MEPFFVWVGEVHLAPGLHTRAVAKAASGSLDSLPSPWHKDRTGRTPKYVGAGLSLQLPFPE